jgi:hypothetical protein
MAILKRMPWKMRKTAGFSTPLRSGRNDKPGKLYFAQDDGFG